MVGIGRSMNEISLEVPLIVNKNTPLLKKKGRVFLNFDWFLRSDIAEEKLAVGNHFLNDDGN